MEVGSRRPRFERQGICFVTVRALPRADRVFYRGTSRRLSRAHSKKISSYIRMVRARLVKEQYVREKTQRSRSASQLPWTQAPLEKTDMFKVVLQTLHLGRY